MRVSDRAVRARVEFSLTEALRLVRLPGEDEGRVYYLRRVALNGVPADGNRTIWQTRLQHALDRCAATAVHGADSRAQAADAVYFESRQEALGTLLRAVVRRETRREWFWPMVTGAGADSDSRAQIVAIVEELRCEPASWKRVARAVFEALGSGDVLALLAAISAGDAAIWLREMDGGEGSVSDAPAVRLSADVRRPLARAVTALGASDPRTLWLAALAIGLISPATFAAGSVVQRARATLGGLARRESDSAAHETRDLSGGAIAVLAFDKPASVTSAAPADVITDAPGECDMGVDGAALPWRVVNRPEHPTDQVAVKREALGEPTAAAGLFFLLNVLMRLGFGRRLQVDPALLESAFAARLLVRLAAHAGVDRGDPVRQLLEAEIEAYRQAFGSPRTSGEALLRMWRVAVQRWCRRAGRLSVRDVVQRPGRISLSQTDLDVALPCDGADIRLRRVGLDIDPGWLPWFGRVVRFHYTLDDPPGR